MEERRGGGVLEVPNEVLQKRLGSQFHHLIILTILHPDLAQLPNPLSLYQSQDFILDRDLQIPEHVLCLLIQGPVQNHRILVPEVLSVGQDQARQHPCLCQYRLVSLYHLLQIRHS